MTKFCLTLGKIFPLKYARKAFAAGALPRTPLGELTTLYQTPSRLGRGTLPPHFQPSSTLSAPRLGAFGAEKRSTFRALPPLDFKSGYANDLDILHKKTMA